MKSSRLFGNEIFSPHFWFADLSPMIVKRGDFIHFAMFQSSFGLKIQTFYRLQDWTVKKNKKPE